MVCGRERLPDRVGALVEVEAVPVVVAQADVEGQPVVDQRCRPGRSRCTARPACSSPEKPPKIVMSVTGEFGVVVEQRELAGRCRS